MSTWTTVPLPEIAEMCLGKMLDKKKNRGTLRPYLANINVRWGALDLEDVREMPFEDRELDRYGLRVGDIVMCEGGEPGRCVLWTGQVPGMMLQKALHRIRPRETVDSRFLFYSLSHKGRTGELEPYFTGATIKHLPGEQLAKVSVTVPPLATQRRISSILVAYDDLIEINRRRVAVLEEMARGLFEQWFVRFCFPGHKSVPFVDTPDGPLPQGWSMLPLDVSPHLGVAVPFRLPPPAWLLLVINICLNAAATSALLRLVSATNVRAALPAITTAPLFRLEPACKLLRYVAQRVPQRHLR